MARRYVALVRGINVGRQNKVVMRELQDAVSRLGYQRVCTILNSGNVLFEAEESAADTAGAIEQALKGLGVPARVIVLTAKELLEVIRDNPFAQIATNPSRLIVAFLAHASDRESLRPLVAQEWNPEAVALGRLAAYMWLPNGTIGSPLAQTLARSLGDAVTTRSLRTVTRIADLIETG